MMLAGHESCDLADQRIDFAAEHRQVGAGQVNASCFRNELDDRIVRPGRTERMRRSTQEKRRGFDRVDASATRRRSSSVICV